MASVASIIIEVQDGQATAALQRVNAEAAKLGPSLAPVQRISEQTFNNIEGGALKARESAALLGEEFGVKVPRALRGVIAESRLLGPIFTAAFSGLAVVGFIEIIKLAVDHLTGFGEALKAIEKQNTELMSSAAAANKTLLGPQTLEQVNARILATEKSVSALNEQLGLTGDLYGDALTRGLAKYNMQQQLEVEELDRKKALLNEEYDLQAKLLYEKRIIEPVEVLKLQNAARLEGLVGIAKINEAARGQTQVLREEIKKQIGDAVIHDAEIRQLHKKEEIEYRDYMRAETDATKQFADQALLSQVKGLAAIKREEEAAIEHQQLLLDRGLIQYQTFSERKNSIEMIGDSKRLELARQALEETTRMEEEGAVAILPAWQRSYAQISIDAQRRLREIQRAFDETRITGTQQAQQIAAVWQSTFAKMRDQLAGDLETLFDNITSGNIGKFFLQQFKHLVFEMVATWILGMQQMKGASQQTMGSGGGILGAIFGSLGLGGIFGGGGGFGGGASGGLGGTPPFTGSVADAGGGFSLAGLGLSAGQAAGTPGTVLPSGAGPGGGIASLLSGGGGGIAQLLAMQAGIGISLLTSSWGKGGLLAGVEGGYGGLLVGGILGAIIGFFGGLFQHSTRKARLKIEAEIKAQAQKLEDSYNTFQADAPSSLTALEALRAQGVDALKKAGVKDIKRSRVGHVDQWIDKAEKEINVTQAERDRRAAIVFGPAEFRTGGFVGPGLGGPMPSWFAGSAMRFAGGGAVPAILHEGEYVMRPEAVSRIGAGNLHHMNYGGGSGEVHVYLTVNTIDKDGFAEFLSRTGGAEIRKFIVRARNEGAW